MRTHPVTLPNVRWMTLHCFERGVPDLLESLKLPSLTSLVVDEIRCTQRPFAILPVTPFGKNPPNFAQLPEMEIAMHRPQHKVSFRSPSQATLDYCFEPLPPGQGHYINYRRPWGSLLVNSIRKAVVDMSTTDGDDGWVVGLLCDMSSLEHLEFRSCYGHTPRCLRQTIMEGNSFPKMNTLAVYFGSEREARQVCRSEDVVDGLGPGISVTWTKDSEIG